MITVYWGANTQERPEGIRVEQPVPILQKMVDERIGDENKGARPWSGEVSYNKCPSYLDNMKNLYGLRHIQDFTLEFDQDGPRTQDYPGDELFFRTFFKVNSWSGNLFTVSSPQVFFTEEKSLMVSFLPAYLEDNDVANKTIAIPGQFDIGKYLRCSSYSFHRKRDVNSIHFKRNDIYMYVKFHTDEKIQFKQFLWTKEMNEMDQLMMAAKKYWYRDNHKIMNLNYFYNIFKRFNFKKKHLKIIKENLCSE